MNKQILKKLSAVTAEERAILAGQQGIDRALYYEDGGKDVITGDKLLDAGKLITLRPHTRFVPIPEHTHDYIEIVYMCQGQTIHHLNKDRLTLKTGELLLLGRSARQSIEAAGKDDIAVNFIVRPEFFGGTLSFLGSEETPLRRFVLDCLGGGSEIGYLYFQVADVLPVQNLVENLLWTLIFDPPNKRGLHQMTMGLLFAELLAHAGAIAFTSPEQGALMRTLQAIEENYRQGSLREIARETHWELTALSRLIKRKTGRTYTELLQEKRLSQSAWLLKNTQEKVDNIALMVGYENSSYFHRLFFRRFGMSPKKYRDCK